MVLRNVINGKVSRGKIGVRALYTLDLRPCGVVGILKKTSRPKATHFIRIVITSEKGRICGLLVALAGVLSP